MGLGDPDKGVGLGFGQTLLELGDPHAGIYHHRDDPRLEQGKGKHKKLYPRSHHKHGFHPGLKAIVEQGAGKPVAVAVQGLEIKLLITELTSAATLHGNRQVFALVNGRLLQVATQVVPLGGVCLWGRFICGHLRVFGGWGRFICGHLRVFGGWEHLSQRSRQRLFPPMPFLQG